MEEKKVTKLTLKKETISSLTNPQINVELGGYKENENDRRATGVICSVGGDKTFCVPCAIETFVTDATCWDNVTCPNTHPNNCPPTFHGNVTCVNTCVNTCANTCHTCNTCWGQNTCPGYNTCQGFTCEGTTCGNYNTCNERRTCYGFPTCEEGGNTCPPSICFGYTCQGESCPDTCFTDCGQYTCGETHCVNTCGDICY